LFLIMSGSAIFFFFDLSDNINVPECASDCVLRIISE
jgi:hypothetical protein